MADAEHLRDPWLVAAWPGMGNVAVGAAGYLIVKLGAQLVHEVSARDLFDVPQIEVKNGMARGGRMPRSMFFRWRDPDSRRDLLIFLGEAQPSVGGYSFCHRLLDYAQEHGVKRIITFAAMATQLHPAAKPRVFGVATDRPTLNEVRELDVEVLREGQISGLNGVLLAAGAERNLPGVCLLGELPFFAAAVPNPKASHAVLKVFASMIGTQLDFTELKKQAEAVEQGLLQLLEKMQDAARHQSETGEELGFTVPEFTQPPADEEDEDEDKGAAEERAKPAAAAEPALDYATRRRIDAMFEDAHNDRSKSFRLKQELDRLGVFSQYEDRFLDLFKKGE